MNVTAVLHRHPCEGADAVQGRDVVQVPDSSQQPDHACYDREDLSGVTAAVGGHVQKQ